MEDKRKTVIAIVAAVAIVVAIGFIAMQAMNGGGSGTVKEPEQYVNQPPSDSSRYRGGDNSVNRESDRM